MQLKAEEGFGRNILMKNNDDISLNNTWNKLGLWLALTKQSK